MCKAGQKRVLLLYGMLIIPKRIPEPNTNDLCLRIPNNSFYWFKRADVFKTLPLELPAFFNDGFDVPGDETSDYCEAPSDESSEDESSDDDDEYWEVDRSSQPKAGKKAKKRSDGDSSEDGASSTLDAKKKEKKKTKARPPKMRKYTKKSRSPDVSEESFASRIANTTEHMTRMELFKQVSAYSKHYLIKQCEHWCVSGMSSKPIPEILRAPEDIIKSGGFTIQKLSPPHNLQVSLKPVDISMSIIRRASIAVQCLLLLLLGVQTIVFLSLPHLDMH